MDEDLKQLLEAMRRENAAAHEETRRHSGSAAADTRRHVDVVTERLEKRFDFLAEVVEHVRVDLQRTRTSLEEKIEHSATETQAMIKFSHRDLDRRVSALEEGQRALEQTVTELQTRLQRLESGTH